MNSEETRREGFRQADAMLAFGKLVQPARLAEFQQPVIEGLMSFDDAVKHNYGRNGQIEKMIMSEAVVDSDTGVRLNRLGISDGQDLWRAEYTITNLRIAELHTTPIPGRFDLDHLTAIHRHLFSDIYGWAGQTRTTNLSEHDWKDRPGFALLSTFAPAKMIGLGATLIGEDLAEQKYLKDLNENEFTTHLAATYVKLNYLHPFPEGNDVSILTMLSQLSHEASYNLDYSLIRGHEWNWATSKSSPQVYLADPTITRNGNPKFVETMFQQIVAPAKEREALHDRDR